MKRLLKKFGFTLIEIMVVIVIMGVIGGIALPRYANVLERQRAQEGKNMLVAVLDAQRRFQLENGNFTNVVANLDLTIAATRYFGAPTPAIPGGGLTAVAIIQRLGGTYQLRIDSSGNIFCAAAGPQIQRCLDISCTGPAMPNLANSRQCL